MSPASWLLWIVSLVILLLLLLIEWRRAAREASTQVAEQSHATRFILGLLLVICASVIAAIWLSTHETMDSGAQAVPWGTVGVLYVAMIAGMVAQYFYFYAHRKFRWRSFIKPFLASPIVFMPLVSAYQKALTSLDAFELGDLMLLLVAFQNGFFWKVIFDKQEEHIAAKQ
jgi:predicted outer membrane lipoprotein